MKTARIAVGSFQTNGWALDPFGQALSPCPMAQMKGSVLALLLLELSEDEQLGFNLQTEPKP